MRRSDEKGRFSAWSFVAPVILVVAVIIVVGVARPILSEVRDGTSSSSSTSTSHTNGTTVPVGTATTRTSKAKGKRFDTVKAGDTFGSIASRNGTTVAKLRKLNPKVDSQSLQLNQRIRVRG